VQLAEVVRGAGEQRFVWARGQAAPGHHGRFLAGLELPEHRFHGAGPQLVIVAAAGMAQPPGGAGGGRKPVQIPGPWRGAVVAAGGVLGQGREQPQAIGVGAGEVLLADLPGVGEHGAQLGTDAGRHKLVPAPVQHRVPQGAVHRVLGQHRAGDDLPRR